MTNVIAGQIIEMKTRKNLLARHKNVIEGRIMKKWFAIQAGRGDIKGL